MPEEGHWASATKEWSIFNLAVVQLELSLALFSDYGEKIKQIETMCSIVYVYFQQMLWMDKNLSIVTQNIAALGWQPHKGKMIS